MDFSLQGILIRIPGVLFAITIHEFAHAFVADKMGDSTPRSQGRLTLNPLAHMDIIGMIAFILIGFGWAKPVETNPSAYKHYYKDDLKVSAAGIIANLISGFVFSIFTIVLFKLSLNANNSTVSEAMGILYNIFYVAAYLNIIFFVFNIIPLPGLDGFHILRDLSPNTFYNIADTLYRYQLIILIVFIAPLLNGNSIATFIVGYPAKLIFSLFLHIAQII